MVVHKSGLKTRVRSKQGLLIIGLLATGLIGSVLLWHARAAGPFVAAEGEAGIVSAPASIVTDAVASGGKAAQFGTTVTPPVGGDLTFPVRTAFYYPWYPETWSVNGAHVFYHPTLGYYDSSTQSVVDGHIGSLDYAHVKMAVASWWGPATQKENTRIPQLLDRTLAVGSPLKWSLYYEQEGFGDPTVAKLQSDFAYIKANYTGRASYAKINGKPVLFVYNAGGGADDTCAIVDRYKQANVTVNFFIVLKLFSGFASCPTQPDFWHQYGPASDALSYQGWSYGISPGFWRADQTVRLARDPARWLLNVKAMVASKAPLQIVTTFNEWGEGTAVEGATEWSSPSGQGTYMDALHDNF